MERIAIGQHRLTAVYTLDEPGQGNACHEYVVYPVDSKGIVESDVVAYANISFQNGPIGEVGVNGCHPEDLLIIVTHFLEGFQTGEFRCRETALAVTKLEEALHRLNDRTKARQARGVEGTNVV